MTTREKRLLAGCAAVVLISGGTIVVKSFLDQNDEVEARISALETQKGESEAWLANRALQEKRRAWLDQMMPTTDSLGRAQGQLLEEMQNALLDLGIKIENTKLPEAVSTPDYREVMVSLNLHGPESACMDWLATLQSPETFQLVKSLEIDPDTKSKEKTPQTFVNITVARWFKPEGS